MEEKDKAIFLIAKMGNKIQAKLCVDEILEEIQDLECVSNDRWNYWQRVVIQIDAYDNYLLPTN